MALPHPGAPSSWRSLIMMTPAWQRCIMKKGDAAMGAPARASCGGGGVAQQPFKDRSQRKGSGLVYRLHSPDGCRCCVIT